MKLKDMTNILTNALGTSVNQSMLATSLGITRQTISNRIKNDSELTVAELTKIETFFDVNITNLVKGTATDRIMIDYYSDIFASCGNGAIVFSDNKEHITIPQCILPNYSKNKKYSMIHARGDSMSNYINDSDKLIVEHCIDRQIIDNKVYVFSYKNEIFVKRISRNLDEIIVKSDNPEYNTRIIKNCDLQDFALIGLIVGIIKAVWHGLYN